MSAPDLIRSRPAGIWFEHVSPPAMTTAPGAAMAAFVGFAAGPAFVAERWEEAAQVLLPAPAEGRLAAAVRAFFANGGTRCLIVPVPGDSRSTGLIAALGPAGALAERTDVDLVCMPDASTALARPVGEEAWSGDSVRAIHAAMLDHCEQAGNRFALLDAPQPLDGDSTAAYAERLEQHAGMLRSAYGALYAPWLLRPAGPAPATRRGAGWRAVRDAGSRNGTTEACPPSGHVAGLIARLDAAIGPQRAPAGLPLDDATDVETGFAAAELLVLHRARVNPLRPLAHGGVEVAGARTLTGQAAWSHVSAARVVTGFRRWLAHAMADLAFEPASSALWDRIATRLLAHCRALFEAGALAGDDPARAFFVKCDAETNGPDEIAGGRVVALVGLAPTTPAEFIILRLAQAPGAEVVTGVITLS